MENFPINMTMSGLSGDGCDVAANVMIDGSVSPSTSSGVSSFGSSYVVSGSNGYATEFAQNARTVQLSRHFPNENEHDLSYD